jgi:DNA-binding response OmpR family regulator
MKILIIEDEILIQKSLTKLLQKKGATVSATSSGKEALGLIYQNKYDRIICDLMLTDISGFDVIEESKKVFTNQEISNKFVIMTAYSSDQVHHKAQEYGCTFLTKPFKSLHDALDIFLKESNA